MAQLGANPVFTDDDWHDLSRAQVRERTLKRVREAYKLLITDGSDVTRRNCRWVVRSCELSHGMGVDRGRVPYLMEDYVSVFQAGDPLAARPWVVRAAGRALRAVHGGTGGAGQRRAEGRVARQG